MMSTPACPDPESLSGYALGTLPPEDADRVEEHVQVCPACEATVNSFDGANDTIMAALRNPNPSATVTSTAPDTRLEAAGDRVPVPPSSVPDLVGPVPTGAEQMKALGNYILLEKIGAGGMGQVFKAQHRRMDRIVALKILPAKFMRDPMAVARFEREVKAAARITHPNIVAAYDADEANGVHFLVMEYVDGNDLSALVKKEGPLAPDQAVHCILQAARGLQAAHAEGIVHRDIKPANLLLDKKGIVKILDMGLARIHDDVTAQAELTATGTVMGTVDYMAPEQALDTKKADARADIYSLGCSLFYVLTGRSIYQGDTLTSRLLAHQGQPIPQLRSLRPDVNEELETVFQKMVAKKTGDRYQSMGELITDLERLEVNSTRTFTQVVITPADDHDQTCVLQSDLIPPANSTVASRSDSDDSGRSRWKQLPAWCGAAAALIAMAAIVINLETKDGTLVVEVDQPDATVQVLDEKGVVEVSQKGGSGKLVITVDPGKHRLRVEKDGFTIVGEEFQMKSGGRVEIAAKLVPLKPSPVVEAKKPLGFEAIGFEEWVESVSGLPVETQLEAIAKRFKELNPWFDGKLTPTIQNGVVTGLEFLTDYVSDISPVRALPELKALYCHSSAQNGKLADLAPLKNLKLTTFICTGNEISDLSPLAGLPLTDLNLDLNKVTDMSPLKEMPLRSLNVDRNGITDLSALRGLRLERLQIGFAQVSDLSPLQGMKLTALTCGGTRITDLSPLKGMPLQGLILRSTEVSDLSPLEGMPLTNLDCIGTKVADLAPLRGMPMETLFISGSPISDLSPLQGMPLSHLDIGNTPASDLSPLQGMSLSMVWFTPKHIAKGIDTVRQMKSLQVVGLVGADRTAPGEFWKKYDAGEFTRVTAFNDAGFQQWVTAVGIMPVDQQVNQVAAQLKVLNPWFDGKLTPTIENGVVTGLSFSADNVTDLSPVRALPGLKFLGCYGTAVGTGKLADLSPLKDLKLENVNFSQTLVADLRPLTGMPLTSLSINHTAVSDLASLSGMALTRLSFYGIKVSDLSPLKGMPLLELGFDQTHVADLSPLQGMQLTYLRFAVSQVANLSPLRGMPVSSLQIGHCPYSDLSPLKGMPLTRLDIQSTQVNDLSPLMGMPLESFICQGTNVHNLSPLIGAPMIELICAATKVSDFSPLKDLPLKRIVCDFNFERDHAIFRSIKTLETINGTPVAEFMKQAEAKHVAMEMWIKETAALPAEQQVDAVSKKLIELNPGFDGKLILGIGGGPPIENGVITGVHLLTDNVTDLTPIRALTGLKSLTCIPEKIPGKLYDLSPLKTMQLTRLICQYNAISDLSPLKGMPLTYLDIDMNPVVDLEPLKGSPLAILNVGRTGVTDLSPLKEMPLTSLNIFGMSIDDLSPLKGLKLTFLACGDTKITDLSPLRGMPLTELHIRNLNVVDISSLEGMPLKTLDAVGTRVTDLLSLKGLPLEVLILDYTPVRDLAPVQKLPLKQLVIHRTPVADLSPLQGMELLHLFFDPRNITKGLDVVRQMKSIQTLGASGDVTLPTAEFWKKYDDGGFTRITSYNDPHFQQLVKLAGAHTVEHQIAWAAQLLQSYNQWFDGKVTPTIEDGVVTGFEFSTDDITDISPVLTLPGLKELRIQGSRRGLGRLSDLSPLKTMKLKKLNCQNTQVSDLSPLKGIPLTTLNLIETKVTDLSPLQGMNLTTVFFTPGKSIQGIDVLRQMKSLRHIGVEEGRELSTEDFWKKYDAKEFNQIDRD